MSDEAEKLPISSHLEELRKTLLWSLVGLIAGVVAVVFFVNPILNFLTQPIGGLKNLQAIEVTETMSVYMRVALLGGLIIALPWIIYQVLRFVGKGLLPAERKGIYLALPFAVLLFLAGVAFAFYIMLPASLGFFQEILDVTTSIRLKSYIGFTTNIMFWIGVSFQLPLVFFVLSKIGIVDSKMLLKGWRVAIVAIAILAAVITPTGDPINMLIFMLPLFVLYLLSILLSALASKPAKAEN
ncbi:MAG: twin-arginine translocase subunit TatC [Chloroflexi bacterium]|jgi:sec-independent protein translocase protein TatC|nr:twin-arginine translocase subunit TatC [Chloroflexota bacterium]